MTYICWFVKNRAKEGGGKIRKKIFILTIFIFLFFSGSTSCEADVSIGDKYYEQGEYDLAVSEYQKSVLESTTDKTLYIKLARCYLQKENPLEAFKLYKRVLEIDSINEEAESFVKKMSEKEKYGFMGESLAEDCTVIRIIKNSPADIYGIKEKDIILEYDSEKIKDPEDLRNKITNTNPGKRVNILVKRNQKNIILQVIIGKFWERKSKKECAQEVYQYGLNLMKQKKFSEAEKEFDFALSIYPRFSPAKIKKQEAKNKILADMYKKGDEYTSNQLWNDALEIYNKIIDINPKYRAVQSRKKQLLENICRYYYTKGKQYETRGKLGNAYFEYEKIEDIDYKDTTKLMKKIKKEILKKIKYNVAVLEFGDEKGASISNNIIAGIMKKKIPILNVVERSAISQILKEQSLTASGLVSDTDTMDKFGRLAGVNSILLGSVLILNVEVSETPTTMMKTYKTGRKITVPNPAYARWKEDLGGSLGEKAGESVGGWLGGIVGKAVGSSAAPSEYIEKDEEETYTYETIEVKKKASINLTYRLVSTETAEMLIAENISEEDVDSGVKQEGNSSLGIPTITLEIKSDAELSKNVVDNACTKVIEGLVSYISKSIRIEKGDELKSAGDDEGAVEEYARLIIASPAESQEVKLAREKIKEIKENKKER